MAEPSKETIARALKLLESHKKASRKYYEANSESIRQKAKAYWENNRDAINQRRRERYQAKKVAT